MIFRNFSFIFLVDVKTILYGHKHSNFTFQQILKKQNIQKTTFIRAAKTENIKDKIFRFLDHNDIHIFFSIEDSASYCVEHDCDCYLLSLSAINLKFMGLFFHYVTSNPPQPAFIFLLLIITEYRLNNLTSFLQNNYLS